MEFTNLHASITKTFAEDRSDIADGSLRKVLIVAEYAMPNGRKALVHVTTDGGNRRLRPWEATGLLTYVLSVVLGSKG